MNDDVEEIVDIVLEDKDGNIIAEVQLTPDEFAYIEEKAEKEGRTVDDVMYQIFETVMDNGRKES